MTKQIEIILTHVQDALDLLVTQFQDSDSIKNIVSALVDETQIVENELFLMLTERNLANATGAQLDRFGTIVDERRNGRTDSAYRAAITAKLTQNLAQGEPERVIELTQTLTGGSYVNLQEILPAVVNLSFDGTIPTSAADFVEIIDSILPAGVRLQGQQLPTSPAVVVTVPNPPDGNTTYTVTIENPVTGEIETFECTTDATPTSQELIDCLVDEINNNGSFSTATDDGNGESFTIISTANVNVTVTGTGMTVTETQLNWFAFAGNPTVTTAGFSSLANPTIGGVLTRLLA